MNGKIIRRITAWIMALLIVFSACMAVASSAPETGEKNLTKIFLYYTVNKGTCFVSKSEGGRKPPQTSKNVHRTRRKIQWITSLN